MRILVHICCGPCAITVIQRLRDAGHELTGFFFNPNIHPLAEYLRRREGAAQVASRLGLPLIFADTLPEDQQNWTDPWLSEHQATLPALPGEAGLPPAVSPVQWLRAVSGRERDRCLFCWRSRLQKTAAMAAAKGFTAFTSSLLYSRYQNHEKLHGLGESISAATGPGFVYEDFRTSWQQGIALSKEWGIYRQPYCGCLFSEYDRYRRSLAETLRENAEE